MKRLSVALILFLPAVSAAADDCPPCVVRVHRHHSAGTGTVVACEGGKSVVLTNRHVAEDLDGVRVYHAGRFHPATYLSHYAGDLVAFTVDAELPCAEIAETEPPAGAAVEQWGYVWYGQGTPVRKTARWFGRAWGIDPRFEAPSPIIDTGIRSESGDSGSAVFYEGKVVAVTWGTTAAVPLAGVRHFLRRACARLFPRLAARLARPAVVVTPPPAAKGDPLPAPKATKPAPKSDGTGVPPAPKAVPKKQPAPPAVYYYPPPRLYSAPDCPPGFA